VVDAPKAPGPVARSAVESISPNRKA
jgi:hypothetical protein